MWWMPFLFVPRKLWGAGHTLCVSTKPLVPGEALYRIHRQYLNTHRGKHRSGGAQEEHTMDQCRSRLKLSENFERHWSIRLSGEIHMDQSLVHTFSWGNSYGPMVLKVLLKFPPILVLVHGWRFPARCSFLRVPNGVFQMVFFRFLTSAGDRAKTLSMVTNNGRKNQCFGHFDAFCPCRSWPLFERTTLKNTV